MSLVVTIVAFSEEEFNGILELCREIFTVSDWMTAWVSGMYML